MAQHLPYRRFQRAVLADDRLAPVRQQVAIPIPLPHTIKRVSTEPVRTGSGYEQSGGDTPSFPPVDR